MKYSEFRDRLESLVCGNRGAEPTEKYLRKLLGQLLLNKEKKPTSELFLQLFESALNSEPVEITDDWFNVKEPGLFSSVEEMKKLNINDFEYTLDTIKFFVADLQRMEEKELENPMRGYGVTSSSGARWYNFTMCGFVDASFALLDESNDKEMDNADLPWYYIASILIVGKIYE